MYKLSTFGHCLLSLGLGIGCRLAEHLLSQGKHMEIQLWKQWNVQQHDSPQEIVVGECKIVEVWQFDAPDAGDSGMTLGPVQTQ